LRVKADRQAGVLGRGKKKERAKFESRFPRISNSAAPLKYSQMPV